MFVTLLHLDGGFVTHVCRLLFLDGDFVSEILGVVVCGLLCEHVLLSLSRLLSLRTLIVFLELLRGIQMV